MKTGENIKESVKEIYSTIAKQSANENATSCCGVGGCATVDHEIFAEDYSKMKGYSEDADLGLGCGIPTEFAHIKEGDTVLDLGSGAGNDCFVARALTGEKGKVIGVDMTEIMVDKARSNADKLGFNNVEFRLGDIESLPIGGGLVDVVVSNCVLNLVPNKQKAFDETFRVLKEGGHFSVSDVVLKGKLPESLEKDAEMYAGCVSGAVEMEEYLSMIHKAGFKDVKVQKEREIHLPDEILSKYLSAKQIEDYRTSETGVYSITVYGFKASCCGPDCC